MVRLPKLPLSMTASVSVMPLSASKVPDIRVDPSRTCRVRTCDVRADTSAGCRSSIEADERFSRSAATTEDRRPRSRKDACVRPAWWIFGCFTKKGSDPIRVTPLDALSAQAETLDDRPIPVDVGLGQVVEQPAALTDQQQQPPAAVVVVLVLAQVLGEVADAPRQQRDLHLG